MRANLETDGAARRGPLDFGDRRIGIEQRERAGEGWKAFGKSADEIG
jgi:hypothetical protein